MNPINKIIVWGIVAVVAVFVWLLLANARLKADLARAQTSGTVCQMANEDFALRLERQNSAIAALKKSGAEKEKSIRAAFEEAQEKARGFFVAAEKLRKAKPRGDACAATEGVINEYIKRNSSYP